MSCATDLVRPDDRVKLIPFTGWVKLTPTIQFLCTLWEVDDGVLFWFFGNKYYFTWRNFSYLLGFNARLPIHLKNLVAVLIDMSFGV